MKTLITLLTVLAMTTVAQAVTTTWTGATSNDWHDPSNWSSGVPTDADTANINGPAAPTWDGPNGAFPTSDSNGKAAIVNIDTSGGNVQLQVGWGPWGAGSWGTDGAVINKNGAGTFRHSGASGWWSASPANTTYNINEGVFQLDHLGEFDRTSQLGMGVTINLNDAEFFYNEQQPGPTPFKGDTLFNVTGNSTLRIHGAASSDIDGWSSVTTDVKVNAGATLSAIPNSGTLYWDNELLIDVSGNSAGKMEVAGNLTLEDDAALTLIGTDSALAPIVVVDYSAGSLTGTFANVTGLPVGASLDYAHAGGTQIAVVGLIPEPSTLVLAVLGLLGLLFFRRRRRK